MAFSIHIIKIEYLLGSTLPLTPVNSYCLKKAFRKVESLPAAALDEKIKG